MPTYTLKTDMQTVGTGLGTWTITVPTLGVYHASCFLTEVPPTGISVAIQQNGSSVIATGALNPNATVYNLDCFIDCAVGDIINIVVTSATTPDLSVPTIKSVMNVRAGI